MLCPVNKYLVVEPILEQKKESGVLVPDDYETNFSSHSLVKLLKGSPESYSRILISPGDRLVVPSHLVEEISFFGEKYHIILESHVVGFFRD